MFKKSILPRNRDKMTAIVGERRWSRQSLIDLTVALFSVPLLIVFGTLLVSDMSDEKWASNPDTRWNVLGLGLALLVVSLLVCAYITYRLGICIWVDAESDVAFGSRYGSTSQQSQDLRSSNIRQHLIVKGDSPPSYESIVSCDQPPPYCSILVFDPKSAFQIDLSLTQQQRNQMSEQATG